MPALDDEMVAALGARLNAYLRTRGFFGLSEHIASGGSAAVFSANTADGPRAFKVFNPTLLAGIGAAAERRRLNVQRRLIGRSCKRLVETYQVEEVQDTVIVEMELVPWPPLTKLIAGVPDDAVAPLFAQLVEAVKFLEENDVVHRDIKPENIHISPDFAELKLLDLGVARELTSADGDSSAITDNENRRPFLATAQYSSPEYLFRLDEPSTRLWKALTFYQLGAVLHDLIMKKPLFAHEVGLGNRWLVARAVLTKVPSFADGDPARLASLKGLAARCLVKDLDARLQLVGWEDFILEGAKDPLTALRARLAKGEANTGAQTNGAGDSRLNFDRAEFTRRFTERVRAELLPSCGTTLPLSVKPSAPGEQPHTRFLLTAAKQVVIDCVVHFVWQEQLYARTANVFLLARILCTGYAEPSAPPALRLVANATVTDSENEPAVTTARAIANAATLALDLMDATVDVHSLHGRDLQSEERPGSKL